MPDIIIKKADISYLKDIQNLNNKLFELEYENFDSSLKVGWSLEKEGTDYFRNMLNNEVVFVALIDNLIVGYLAGSKNIEPSYVVKPLAEIDNMFILEDYRKFGVGTRLINEFKQYCLENDITEVKVTASTGNVNAIKFYKEKNGFDDFEITLKCQLDRSW